MSRPQFPKMVYHNETGHQYVAQTSDDIPDGYITLDEYNSSKSVDAAVDAASGAILATEAAASRAAADEADAARKAATEAAAEAERLAAEQKAEEEKVAEKAERDRIKAFLDEHNVEYVPQIGTAKLKELEAALIAHLEAEKAKNDTGE